MSINGRCSALIGEAQPSFPASASFSGVVQLARKRATRQPALAVRHKYTNSHLIFEPPRLSPYPLICVSIRSSSMQSRKRSWSGPSELQRTQKRACSNPSYRFPAVLTRDEAQRVTPTSQMTDIPMETSISDVRTGCIHKRSCVLSQPNCCACSDKRPLSHVYLLHGNKETGVWVNSNRAPTVYRSIDYCPGCKGTFRERRLEGVEG